jgi:hypothetical protein
MRVRDGLPENANYHDDGCDIYDSCLTCPLPACRYEMPPGRARVLAQASTLGALLRQGHTMDQAADLLGVSRRTVYRLRRVDAPRGTPGYAVTLLHVVRQHPLVAALAS